MATSEALTELVRRWMRADPDPVTRAELEDLLSGDDVEALEQRFAGGLRFGTSGLRAPLGAGPTRMNRVVARQVAAGLMDHLASTTEVELPSVVIGHDARRGSEQFAADVASVVEARGGSVFWLPANMPTPVLVWAIPALQAVAGVMCTASHNPAEDNGVKVYLGDALQPLPPEDAVLAERIARSDPGVLDALVGGSSGVTAAARVGDEEVVDRYVDQIASLVDRPRRGVRLVYTPLHGVGWSVLRRAFVAAGLDEPLVVRSQRDPDGEFPTAPMPNPEEPGVLDLAIARAAEDGADAVLANDPDADRLALVVPARGCSSPRDRRNPEQWEVLSGNQLGWLLADHLLGQGSGSDRLVVTAFESSRVVQRLAQQAGVHHRDVPTGFKWIMHEAISHPDWRFVFGCEEALGYAVTDRVRDKDGIAAALVAADLLGSLIDDASTVWDRLDDIARRVGHHATDTRFVRLCGAGAPERLDEIMADLRRDPPGTIGSHEVRSMHDLADGSLGVPIDALVFALAGEGRLVIRPSGTEPKCKVYAEVRTELSGGSDRPDAWWASVEESGKRAAAELAAAGLERVTGARPTPH